MGARTIYLIPADDDVAPKAYCQKVVRTLVSMGVIDEEEDEDECGYPPGPRSTSILTKTDAEDAFESCEVHGSRKARLIPQEAAVSPSCPKCNKKLEDVFYEVVNEVEENADDEPDYSKVRLTCPKCKASHSLVDLKDPVGIFLATKYVCMEDVQGKLSEKWLAELVKKTGFKHRVYEYWYT